MINKCDIINGFESALILDDDLVSSHFSQIELKRFGIKNVTAYNDSKDALAFLLNTPKVNRYVFIDLYMPTTNGFDFIEKINKMGISKNLKLFILSNSVNTDDKLKAESINIPFIEKPLSTEKLQKKLKDSFIINSDAMFNGN